MNTNKKYKDSEIIDSLRKRESHILKYIYDQYFDQIRNFVLKNDGTIEDAKDVFQDSLIIILEKIDDKDTLEFNFGTYLFNRVSFLWSKIKEKRDLSFHKNSIKKKYSSDLRDDEITDIIEEYLNHLKPDSIQALFLYYDGISYEDIAKKIGLKDGKTAKRRVNSAKSKLMKVIIESDEYKNLIPLQTHS